MLELTIVKEVINDNYNRFFTCATLVNDMIANKYEVSLKYVLDCKKRAYDPFSEDRRGLSVKIGRSLGKLKDEGYIEKYGRYVWRIVK